MQERILNEIVGKKPRILSKEEASWLAGVIDGEGSIGLYNYGKEGRRVCIQAINSNREFMEKIREIIGCGSSVMRTNLHIKHKGRKPVYHYTLKGSARCYIILKQIEPYLIIKKDIAKKIIKEIEEYSFGRWKNSTIEAKQKQSELMKKSWQDPLIRLRRLLSMKKSKQFLEARV